MSELERLRREMDKALRTPGAHPDRSVDITRRIFLHRSLLTGGAVAAGAFGGGRSSTRSSSPTPRRSFSSPGSRIRTSTRAT